MSEMVGMLLSDGEVLAGLFTPLRLSNAQTCLGI